MTKTILNIIKFTFASLLASIGLYSCDISKNDVKPLDGFTKIYDIDSAQFNHSPIDIKQLNDGGYLILGYDLQDQANTLLVRTDKEGKIQWHKTLPEYFNPISDLMQIGQDYYFVSSRVFTFEIVLLKVSDVAKGVEEAVALNENKRPLAACSTPDGGVLIQTYDFIDNLTVIMKLNNSFQLDASFSDDGKKEFEVSEPDLMNERVTNHLTFQGERFPFFVSYISSGSNVVSYIYNGVNNYDISVSALNPRNGNIQGTLFGFRYKKLASSFIDLGNGSSGLSKYDGSFHYFIPNYKLNDFISGEIANVSDLNPAIKRPEILNKSAIKTKLLTIKGRRLLVYLAELNNNKIGLYAYDANNGDFLGQRYIGDTFAYKLGNVISTSDGGLAIICQTLVGGRFGRICLFKLSQEQAEAMID